MKLHGFHDPGRIQGRLGRLSPIEFEEEHYAGLAGMEPVHLRPRLPALTTWSAISAQRRTSHR
ncbi:hypothetical protein [Streptomyces sp. PTD5-9]|uniref:hypothetical protein n=1 Tax=Streptomyces sp. PTD5-9 TaxID=3120150 RepID=UPI0030097B85